MLVTGGSPANFNYPTYDEAADLFVAALIYDVTTGIPALDSGPIEMLNINAGIYVGVFTPLAGKSYLVVMNVYTDAGFTIVDGNRAPAAEQYDAFIDNTSLLNFNYGSFDLDSGLDIEATIYNLTDLESDTLTMDYVANGVYFGQFQGEIDKDYIVTKVPTNTQLAPGADSFQCFAFNNVIVENTYSDAVLEGQSLHALLGSTSMQDIVFTQGDTAVLSLTATNGDGLPFNITGAVFTTQIKGPNNQVIATFGNSQHTIVSALLGQFQLSLGQADTNNCGLGAGKEIVTKIVQGSSVIYFHGIGILTVLPSIPLQ